MPPVPFAGRSRENRGGTLRLALAVAAIADRVNEDDESRALPLAVVDDPRARSLTVRLPGATEPHPATCSDLFDLYPLETGDLVVVVPISGGGWHVLDRVSGSGPGPETAVSLDDIPSSLVQAGDPIAVEGEVVNSQVQWFRGPSTSFTATATDVTWPFVNPFSDVPHVMPGLESSAAGATALMVVLKSVTKTTAVITVFNSTSPTGVSARVLAMAHGAV